MSKYKSLVILNGVLFAFLLVMLFLFPINVLKEYQIKNYVGEYTGEAVLYGDASIRQSFICNGIADSFNIRVEPLNNSYYGSFTIRLYDDNGNLAGEWIIDKLDIEEGWAECTLKEGSLLSDNRYSIEVTAPDLEYGDAISLGLGSADSSASGVEALVYRQAEDAAGTDYSGYTMSFGVYRYRLNVFAILAIIILFIVANGFMIFRDKGMDFLALPVLLGMGLIMLVIYPFGYTVDERTHYYSAFELSNIILGHENTGEIDNKYYIENDAFRNTNDNDLYIRVLNEILHRKKAEEGCFDNLYNKSELSQPVSHLAPALGITLGRIMNLSVLQTYELARMFNMLSYALMVFIAVKLIPVNKELMVMLGINPMALRLATSLSYDAPVIGLSYIFFGYIIRLMHAEKKIAWADILICLALIVIMSPIKIIYVLLCLLILAVPGRQFNSLIDRIVKSSVLIFVSFLVIWKLRMQAVIGTVTNSGLVIRGQDNQVSHASSYTSAFVFAHPVRFIKIILSNALQGIEESLYGMFGGQIGIPRYIVLGFILIVLICALSEEAVAINSRYGIILFVGIAIVGYFVIFYVFMMAETIYGWSRINGWQPRYLIPFIPQLTYCICGSKGSLKINRKNLFMPLWFVELMYIFGIVQNIAV